ncbi:MAG: hypothetical protein ABFR32_05960 [Bacteroidota bacterium]
MYIYIIIVVLISCSSSDENPPTAGFSLSNEKPVQWDKVNIIDKSKEAGNIVYEVIGGEYSLSTDQSSIVFFESNSYTVNQIITNSLGSDTFSINIDVLSTNNKYTIDDVELPFNNSAFWYDATNTGGMVYIRILAEVEGNDNPNLIKLFPISGSNPIHATYIWGDNGDIGTYDAGVIYNWKGGNDYDWITKGENGQALTIELFYEDQNNSDNNAYIITLPSYTLNYGYWNPLLNRFEKEGEKSFSLYYKGKIDPLD